MHVACSLPTMACVALRRSCSYVSAKPRAHVSAIGGESYDDAGPTEKAATAVDFDQMVCTQARVGHGSDPPAGSIATGNPDYAREAFDGS